MRVCPVVWWESTSNFDTSCMYTETPDGTRPLADVPQGDLLTVVDSREESLTGSTSVGTVGSSTVKAPVIRRLLC